MTLNTILEEIQEYIRAQKSNLDDWEVSVEILRDLIAQESPTKSQPVDHVRWINIGRVVPNSYNPNAVAKIEMGLLYTSILHDGLTQPIVTVYNPESDQYEIIDGFHRYFTVKSNPDLLKRTNGMVPIVVLDKSMNERMAATVRHNRARGSHSVHGMSNLVFSMLEGGWEDAAICNELGMEPEELLRLKHITGFSKLFENVEYRKSWMSSRQILIKKQYLEAQHEEALPEST